MKKCPKLLRIYSAPNLPPVPNIILLPCIKKVSDYRMFPGSLTFYFYYSNIFAKWEEEIRGQGFRVARGECRPLIACESSTRQLGVRSGGAAHKNREVPRSFDSASRRRHRKRCPRSFLHSGQYHIGAASKRRLGATYFCFHTSFVYRSARKIEGFARNDDTSA